MGALDRRLAAVWFADIVGFTLLADSDEDAALETVAVFQAAARAAVEERGGRVVKFLGDGALAEFASARAALDSALALCASFSSSGSRSATSIRIGLHVGEVAGTPDGDLYGDGLNLAARLQAEAAPGEVVVSEDAARALRHSRGFRFDSLGDRALKGYNEPALVYRASRAEPGPELGGQRRRAEPGSTGSNAERSIAVLPFTNLSPDPEHEYFSDGVTEEILTSLAKIEGLKFISRTSVMRYKGATRSLREIGRELGVASVLEGSVRHAGGRVRITAQLVDAAEADFRRAVEVAPGDAQARQWRAHLLVCLGRYHEAVDEIDRALELDPLSLAVITEAGNVRFLARRYDEAPAYYRQAIDLDPVFRPARYKLFETYLSLGLLSEAMREAERLDLVDPASGATTGSGPEAERRFLEALVKESGENDWPLFYAASAKAALGMIDEALRDLKAARDEGDWFLVRAAVAPQCDSLRGDPRFAEFLASIGLAGIPLAAESETGGR